MLLGMGRAVTSRRATRLEFPRNPVLFVVLALTACGSLALLTTVPLHEPGAGLLDGGIDLIVYRTGGWFVLEDLPLYDGPIVNGLLYTYTPFSALLFSVVALAPTTGLVSAWLAFNIVVLCACVVMSWVILGYRLSARLVLASALIGVTCMFLEPVRDTLQFGQINLVLLLLILSGFVGNQRGWHVGVGAGIATGIKLTPGLFIVFYCAAGRWRAAAVTAGVFVGTIVLAWLILPGDSYEYWFHTFFDSSRISEDWHLANQSVNGAIARLSHVPQAPALLWAMIAGIVAVAGLYVATRLYRRDERLLAAIVTGLTSSMVSPFSWSHHWVWFVPLTVYFLHRAFTSTAAWWAAAAALYCATASWVYNFPNSNPVVGFYVWPVDAPLYNVTQNLYPLLYVPILAMAFWVATRPQ